MIHFSKSQLIIILLTVVICLKLKKEWKQCTHELYYQLYSRWITII